MKSLLVPSQSPVGGEPCLEGTHTLSLKVKWKAVPQGQARVECIPSVVGAPARGHPGLQGRRRACHRGSQLRFSRKPGNHFHRALCINLHGREYSLHVVFPRLTPSDQNDGPDSGHRPVPALGMGRGVGRKGLQGGVRLESGSSSRLG